MMIRLFALLCLVSVACTAPVERTLGDACDADDQCATGLSCLPLATAGRCGTQKQCTTICSDDGACKALDSSALCLAGCNDTLNCARTGSDGP